MKQLDIDKKVILWTWIFRSLGLIASTAVVQENWKLVTVLGVLVVGASEIKDYYLKKQNPQKSGE